jgi:hypothetical protein
MQSYQKELAEVLEFFRVEYDDAVARLLEAASP